MSWSREPIGCYRPFLEEIESRILPGETLGVMPFSPFDLLPDTHYLTSKVRFADVQPADGQLGPRVDSPAIVPPTAASPDIRTCWFDGSTVLSSNRKDPGKQDILEDAADATQPGLNAGPRTRSGPRPSFIWQDSWQVGLRAFGGGDAAAAFGAGATAHGQITDVGQAGDEGPSTTTARASAWAVSFGYEYVDAEAVVSFRRTFTLSDSPGGLGIRSSITSRYPACP